MEHEGLNGYICFYRGKRIEVYAKTQLEARDKAAATFKARKAYNVTAALAEKWNPETGKRDQVTHIADS